MQIHQRKSPLHLLQSSPERSSPTSRRAARARAHFGTLGYEAQTAALSPSGRGDTLQLEGDRAGGAGRRTAQAQHGVPKAQYRALYERLKSNATAIKIHETTGTRLLRGGQREETYPGFRYKILRSLITLISRRAGYDLVKSLAGGSKTVEIRPMPTNEQAEPAFADAHDRQASRNGKGSATTVYLHPFLANETQQAYDEDGRPISFPVFLMLGHELIHAQHNQAGEAEGKRRSDHYATDEEYETIAGGDHQEHGEITENTLRDQFGLRRRDGHDGRGTGKYTKSVKEIRAGL